MDREEKNLPKVLLLTDELISMYTEDNVLSEYRDINLRVLNKVDPYQKGVYDPYIFGSIFSDRCNCGNVRSEGLRCPNCGSMVLGEDQIYKRFARIESPVYYTMKYKIDKIRELIRDNFNVVEDLKSKYFEGMKWREEKVLDICQWSYDKETNTLTISDDVTDYTRCSYEGLIRCLSKDKQDVAKQLRSFMNQYIIVIPMALRAPAIKMVDGVRKLQNHQITVIYQNLIYCICEYYRDIFPTLKTESGRAIFRGSLRALIRTSLGNLSKLTKTSKENLARSMQSNNLPNSGRCTIVPDPTLEIDEVSIPIHFAYEMCREEFTKYIAKRKKVSDKKADLIYKTGYDTDEVQKMFKEYINGEGDAEDHKYIIINRAPSLYEHGMAACKMKITHDYVMKIPQSLCVGFNADFDGDQMAFYAVPKEMNAQVTKTLSPRNIFLFKRNKSPIYTPTQEVLHGMILATKVSIPEGKPMKFDSLQDAKDYKEGGGDLKYQTLIELEGIKTTLGREILSELFDKDVNAYLGSPDKNLNSKNMLELYEQLRDKPDRPERIQKIQEFCLYVTTMSGYTSPRLSELYSDIDEGYLNRIKAIDRNTDLTDDQKHVAIREIYKEFQQAQIEKIPEGVRTTVSEGNRGNMNSILAMSTQQLNVGPRNEFSVSSTTLLGGMSPEDYENHAIENRALQDIKQLSVPSSGYLTRQFVFLASEYIFKDIDDPENEGIHIKRSEGYGRTTVQGEVLGKSNSDEEVMVRSIVTSHAGKNIITRDMVSTVLNFTEDSRVGMSLISSMTEKLTQKGLSLKHGGNLYNLYPENALKAPEDGTMEVTDKFVIFHGKSGQEYKYPKSERFVENFATGGKYKKGDHAGFNYQLVTPAFKLDSIIRMSKAAMKVGKAFARNEIVISDCYCMADGTIHYEEGKKGKMVVRIGDVTYNYNPNCLYYFPEGAKVKKYERICTGVVDLRRLSAYINDYVDTFYFFKEQFNSLDPDPSAYLSSEILEFLYVLLVNSDENDDIVVSSVKKSIHSTDSFYKALSFEDARKSFLKVESEGVDLEADPLSSVVLNLILNDKLD